jgi:hypothetical protein
LVLVLQIFENQRNTQFHFIEKFANQRVAGSNYFRTLKEPEVFMRELTKNWQFCGLFFDFFIFLRIGIIY